MSKFVAALTDLTFWEGFARGFDLRAASPNLESYLDRAQPHTDAAAIAADWAAVGNDLYRSLARFAEENPTALNGRE